MRTRRSLISLGCGVLALVLPVSALAQAPQSPAPLSLVYATAVKPGMQPQFEAGMGKLIAAYTKANSPVRWTTFVSAVGGTGPTYYSALPMQKMGDVDGWPAVAGEQEILQSMGASAQQTQTMIMGLRPDLSYAPEGAAPLSGPPPLGYVYAWTVKPGGAPQFEAAFTKTVEAYRKAQSPMRWTTSASMVGGTAQTYISVIPMQKYGDIDGWQGSSPAEVLGKAYGEAEAAKLMQSFSAVVDSTQVSIIASRPDLSRP